MHAGRYTLADAQRQQCRAWKSDCLNAIVTQVSRRMCKCMHVRNPQCDPKAVRHCYRNGEDTSTQRRVLSQTHLIGLDLLCIDGACRPGARLMQPRSEMPVGPQVP